MSEAYIQRDPASIRSLFGTIASTYDRGNALLSLGMHRRWNRALVSVIQDHLNGPLLDLCAGTGEIALTYLKKAPPGQEAHLLDFSSNMLEQARLKGQRLTDHTITYYEADAHKIPLGDETISLVTTAYGVRNLADPVTCARDVYRVLKPGGLWGILELTRPSSRFIRLGHKLYLKLIVPVLGGLLSSNPKAYRYLSKTITAFDRPEKLATDFATVGFQQREIRPLMGGIATLTVLQK